VAVRRQGVRKRGVGAFTLVELLVVVALMGVLVGLMLPTLGRARQAARQVVCQAHLRSWGLGFSAYAVENGDCWPHTDGLDRQDASVAPRTPADRADYYGWVDVLAPLMGERAWRDYPLGERPGPGSVFQCAAARLGPTELYGYDAKRLGWFSYAMNSCLELDENCWRNEEEPGRVMPSFLKVSLIRGPEQVILLFDQLLDPRLGYDGKAMNRSAGRHCGSYPKAFSARHGRGPDERGGSILHCDGHVDWAASVWKPDWPVDLEVPPRSDREWFPY